MIIQSLAYFKRTSAPSFRLQNIDEHSRNRKLFFSLMFSNLLFT